MKPQARSGRRLTLVVTAGPTREHVDPVRFLTNESSGQMGFALARTARSRGHRTILIAGPVALATPRGVERIDVVSGREMLAAVERAFRGADALIMCAAVCDWRPARRRAGKWRAKDAGGERAALDLIRNPDILARVAGTKGRRLAMGFALETGNGLARAKKKLLAKHLDWIVLNDASVLNSETTSVTILARQGGVRRLRRQSKARVARELVWEVEQRAARTSDGV